MTAPLPRADATFARARCRTCGAEGVTIGPATKHLFVHRQGENLKAPFCEDSDLGPHPLDYTREIAEWMDREKVVADAARAQLEGK